MNCRKTLTEDLKYDIDERKYIEDPHFDNLLRGWLKEIRQGLDNPDPYKSFIYLWFIFNSWLSYIAPDPNRSEEDRYLIQVIAGSNRFNALFDNLFSSDTEFKGWTEKFISLGPIFRVGWLKKNKIQPWDSEKEKRKNYVSSIWKSRIECNDKPTVSPKCFADHYKEKIPIPFDWSHTIHMVYQVRCNLFHGGKSFDSKEDFKFVQLALKILWAIFKEEDFVKNALREIGELDTPVREND